MLLVTLNPNTTAAGNPEVPEVSQRCSIRRRLCFWTDLGYKYTAIIITVRLTANTAVKTHT